MLATCSLDKTVTLWDTYNASKTPTTGPPNACGNKEMGVGKLYTVNYYPSAPWLLGCAGSGKELAIWDMTRETTIQKRFASRIGVEAVSDENESDGADQKEAFDAMMSTDVQKTEESSSPKPKIKSKKGGNKTKKAHKAKR